MAKFEKRFRQTFDVMDIVDISDDLFMWERFGWVEAENWDEDPEDREYRQYMLPEYERVREQIGDHYAGWNDDVFSILYSSRMHMDMMIYELEKYPNLGWLRK